MRDGSDGAFHVSADVIRLADGREPRDGETGRVQTRCRGSRACNPRSRTRSPRCWRTLPSRARTDCHPGCSDRGGSRRQTSRKCEPWVHDTLSMNCQFWFLLMNGELESSPKLENAGNADVRQAPCIRRHGGRKRHAEPRWSTSSTLFSCPPAVIEKLVVADTKFIHERRAQDPRIVDDGLVTLWWSTIEPLSRSPSGELRIRRPSCSGRTTWICVFSVKSIRVVNLVLVGPVLVHREVVVGQTRGRLVRHRVVIEQLQRDGAEPRRGDDVSRKRRVGEGISDSGGCAPAGNRAFRKITTPHRDGGHAVERSAAGCAAGTPRNWP